MCVRRSTLTTTGIVAISQLYMNGDCLIARSRLEELDEHRHRWIEWLAWSGKCRVSFPYKQTQTKESSSISGRMICLIADCNHIRCNFSMLTRIIGSLRPISFQMNLSGLAKADC